MIARLSGLAALLFAGLASPGFAQAETEIASLEATTIRTYSAPEADQGAAVDLTHFYAVDNSEIAKYRRDTGEAVGKYTETENLISHMNSCYARDGFLMCANSNYPDVPMGLSVEVFDANTMQHVASRSLGLREEGSLTWFDTTSTGYIAGFAHYDGKGGTGFKSHAYSSIVSFDSSWQRTGGWLFPASVMERMKPYAASGGAIGPDGLLYIMGHDRPEMYVLAMPTRGPSLIHVATIALEAEGQAFSWAPDSRSVFVVDRKQGLVREISIPALSELPDAARLFLR